MWEINIPQSGCCWVVLDLCSSFILLGQKLLYVLVVNEPDHEIRESGSSVVEYLTRDRGAAGPSLTGVTALWSLSKTHLS